MHQLPSTRAHVHPHPIVAIPALASKVASIATIEDATVLLSSKEPSVLEVRPCLDCRPT